MANEEWAHLAVDWAKNQIDELKASRDALLAAFGDISKLDTEGSLVDWLRALEANLRSLARRVERDYEKVEASARQTTELEKKFDSVSERAGRLEEELEGTDRSVSAHADRLAALEIRLTAYGVPLQGSFKIPPLKGSGKEFQFYQPPTDEERHLDEFSPPIGGRPFHAPNEPQIVSSLRTGGQRYQEWRRRSAESAHLAGETRKEALQGAAIRVNDYLTKGQFSEETIKEVLAAVWGAEGPLGEGAVE